MLEWIERIKSFFETTVLQLGSARVTLWSLLNFIVLALLLIYLSGKLRKWLIERVLVVSQLDVSARQAVGSVTRYLVLLIGFLIILQTVGIDLTTLNVIAGAVGIGIGFGLQNVASNFISGLIILFERPIKIGDRIVVGDIEGDVVEIGARSTRVLTNDNITVIVPNSNFISQNVINWKYGDTKIRFKIPVGVAYGSDVDQVERLLLEVARETPDVLTDPAPGVRFLELGESGLQFELRAWTTTLLHRKGRLFSALNFAIYKKFNQHGVVFSSPQRELLVRGGALEVSLQKKPVIS